MRSPPYDQVLTGVLPYDDNNVADMITRIKEGQQPSRPMDPSQNQWLQDRVWDTITTCWSINPQQRCELFVVHHIFSTQDALVKSPPVGRKNLIRLAKELLYTLLILPMDPGELVKLKTVQEYISNAISRDRTSTTTLSSAEVTALAKTFRKVSFPARISISL
jgi:hypothetical protein